MYIPFVDRFAKCSYLLSPAGYNILTHRMELLESEKFRYRKGKKKLNDVPIQFRELEELNLAHIERNIAKMEAQLDDQRRSGNKSIRPQLKELK